MPYLLVGSVWKKYTWRKKSMSLLTRFMPLSLVFFVIDMFIVPNGKVFPTRRTFFACQLTVPVRYNLPSNGITSALMISFEHSFLTYQDVWFVQTSELPEVLILTSIKFPRPFWNQPVCISRTLVWFVASQHFWLVTVDFELCGNITSCVLLYYTLAPIWIYLELHPFTERSMLNLVKILCFVFNGITSQPNLSPVWSFKSRYSRTRIWIVSCLVEDKFSYRPIMFCWHRQNQNIRTKRISFSDKIICSLNLNYSNFSWNYLTP